MPDVKTFRWLFVLPLLAPTYAFAQVQVNPAALQQLQGLPPAPAAVAPPPIQAPARKPAHPKQPHEQTARKAPPTVLATEQKAPAPTPTETVAAPSNPTPNVTLHTPVLPPTIKIEFAAGSALLPADADAALKPFCTSAGRIHILAHAAGSAQTPSGAMPLAMQRAFAVRAALMNCGIAAQNIIPQSIVAPAGPDSDEALIGAMTRP